MRLLYKDQLMKIKQNMFYFISLSLLVMIISLTYTSVKTSVSRLEENYDEYIVEQNLEDFYFALNTFDITYLTGAQQFYICQQLGIIIELSLVDFDDGISVNNINALISGLLKENQELYNEMTDAIAYGLGDTYDLTIEKIYVKTVVEGDYRYKFHTVSDLINVPYIVDGRVPVADYEVAIFPEFAAANNILIDDTLTINNIDYLVVGYMYKVEYMLPLLSMSTLEYDEQYQSIVLMNTDTIYYSDEFVFNKYLGIGSIDLLFTDFGIEDIVRSDLSFLGKNAQMVSIILPSSMNFRIISLPKEVENAKIFIDIFISIFTVLISVLLLVFMKRYIDKNREDIDTLYALGYNNYEITKMLMVFPLIISINAIIGYFIGLLLSNKLFELYSARYLYPKSGFSFDLNIMLISVVVPITMIIVFNLIFIIRALKLKKKGLYKKIFKFFKFTPFKTILITSFIFLAINIMIIFSVTGNHMFTSFIDYTKTGNNYEQRINLVTFTDEELGGTETPFTKATGLIESINGALLVDDNKLSIYGIDSDNEMRVLINNDLSKNLLLDDGLIISEYTASIHDISVGDIITYSVGKATFTEEVLGISNELLQNALYTSRETLNSLYELEDTYYNGIYSTDELYDNPLKKSSVNYNQSVDEFSSILRISSMIISYLLILSGFLSLFILWLIIYTYLNDNKINFAILKSVGYTNYEINTLYLKNIVIEFIVMFIVAIPFTRYLINIILTMLMENLGFQLILSISFYQLLFSFSLVSIILVLSIYFVNRYINKVQIAVIMQKNIK